MPAREVFLSVGFLISCSGVSLAWVPFLLVRLFVRGLWSSIWVLFVTAWLPWLLDLTAQATERTRTCEVPRGSHR